jgi:hypothetical protein
VSWGSPRRLALVGLLATVAGVVLRVGLALATGGGLSGAYASAVVTSNVFYGSVILIAIGAAIALRSSRSSGVALMLIAAQFEVGVGIGSLIYWTLLHSSISG